MRWLWIFAMALVVSCQTNTPVQPEFQDQDFIPLKIGHTWIYQVDSIIFDPDVNGIRRDSTSGFIQEMIRDTFYDLEGEMNFLIERSYRKNESDSWQLQRVDYAKVDQIQAERVENNLRKVILQFPLRVGARWDGNVFFDPRTTVLVAGESIEMYKNWSYSIRAMDQSITLKGILYDHVVQVIPVDDGEENLIERRYSEELYAPYIGLIYRKMEILDSQNLASIPWSTKAEKGFILEQTLISFTP